MERRFRRWFQGRLECRLFRWERGWLLSGFGDWFAGGERVACTGSCLGGVSRFAGQAGGGLRLTGQVRASGARNASVLCFEQVSTT